MNSKQKVFVNVFIMLIVLSTKLLANIQTTERFSLSDGLPSNAVFDIFEDSRGLVWLATGAGLYEFTGENINYRKELMRLQGERVNSICEDGEGNLWISSLGVGLSSFDGENLSVIHLDSLNKDCEIYCLQALKTNNKLVLGTSEGLYEFTINKPLLTTKKTSYANAIYKIRAVENNLIVNSKCQTDNFISDINNVNDQKNRNTDIPIVSLGKQNNIEHLKSELAEGKPFYLKLSKDNLIYVDVIEQEGNAILSYYLLRYFENGIEKRKILKLQENELLDFSDSNGLNDFFIHTIFIRKGQNDLWFGSQNYGLVKVKNNFLKYIDTGFTGFQNPQNQDLVLDNYGNIIISNKDKIVIINDLQIKKQVEAKDFHTCCSGKVADYTDLLLYRIVLAKNGLVWISSNKGFFTLDTKTYYLQFIGISPANEFVFNQKGELFYFWNNTFHFYNQKDSYQENVTYSFEQERKIEISKILTQGDNIWIATKQKGIIRVFKDKIFIYNRENLGIHNVINDLIVVDKSTIIAGGNDGLIYKLKLINNDVKLEDTIGNKDGIVGTTIQGFQFLDDNSLWCGTNIGVHRIDYSSWQKDSSLQFRFWNLNDGYYDRNGGRSLVDREDNIWVQTRNRLLKIEAKRYKDQDQLRTRIGLRSILVQNKQWVSEQKGIDKWTHAPIEPVVFKYFENDITFNFGMDFCQNISNVRFRYILEGYDKTWSDWKTSTEAMYSHVPGGDYCLRIEGRQLSDRQIVPFSFHIKVEVRWWKTGWFIALASILLFVLVIVLAKTYVRIIKRREKVKTKQFNRVIALKMKTLQTQLDPHFIFNALNSIQSHILEENTENALDFLADFSIVLRKNINNASKDYISLADEINYLEHYLKLEQMRFSDKFSYHIKVNSAINLHGYLLPPMLIQPFIENTIKYALSRGEEKGELDVIFETEEDAYLTCVITVSDLESKKINGGNQVNSTNNYHKSLQVSRERIKLLNAVIEKGRVYSYLIEDLTDDLGNSCGSKVVLGFPKI